MKVWDYVYVYASTDDVPNKWTEIECYEQPWWAVFRAWAYHKFVCMRSNKFEVDLRCYDYSVARRRIRHMFKEQDGLRIEPQRQHPPA